MNGKQNLFDKVLAFISTAIELIVLKGICFDSRLAEEFVKKESYSSTIYLFYFLALQHFRMNFR